MLAINKMTLYRLERKSGILHGTMSSIMRGKTNTINLATIILIAQGFGISLQEFLNDPLFDYENLEI